MKGFYFLRNLLFALAALLTASAALAEEQNEKKLVWNVDSLTITCGPNSYRMLYVPEAEFYMGATGKLNAGSSRLEKPNPLVQIPGYLLGETEVPQWLWTAVMGKNPSWNKGEMNPVENVTALEVRDFLDKLNEMVNALFRLPTEVEWELAAKEGSKDTNNLYSGGDDITAVAWYLGNSGDKSHPVKMLAPNKLGFYDLTGNVSELCSNELYRYKYGTVIDPFVYTVPQDPAIRGGNWRTNKMDCRLSRRDDTPNNRTDGTIGFRLAY